MTIFFVASFIAGLGLAVGIMLFGIERPDAGSAGGTPAIRTALPGLAAFLIVVGLVGYGLRVKPPATSALWAALCGVAAAAFAVWGSGRWARVVPEHDVDDPRYVLQGHVARVTQRILPDADGEIAIDLGAETRTLRARGDQAQAIEAGVEVVIERIEGDVAYVESWSAVEERL